MNAISDAAWSFIGSFVGAGAASIVVWFASRQQIRQARLSDQDRQVAERNRSAIEASGIIIAELHSAPLYARQFRARFPELAPRLRGRLVLPSATDKWMRAHGESLARALRARAVILAMSRDSDLLVATDEALAALERVTHVGFMVTQPAEAEWEAALTGAGEASHTLQTAISRLGMLEPPEKP